MSAWNHKIPEFHDVQCQLKHLKEQILSESISCYAFPINWRVLYIVYSKFETNSSKICALVEDIHI